MTKLNNKSKIIIVALTLFIAMSIGLGFLFTNLNESGITANAESNTYFAMEDGIAIKLNKDGGMRFIAKMDTTLGEELRSGEKTMKFIIAPKDIFDNADNSDVEYKDLTKKILINVDPLKVYPDNIENPTYYYANGCVTNMKEANYNRIYEAVGYIVEENRYTERNEKATGSFYEKVNATFLNQNIEDQILSFETYRDWYGTEKYPIYIKNPTQYQSVVAKCNSGNTAFADKYVWCENGVEWNSSDFTNEETKPTIIDDANKWNNGVSDWQGDNLGSSLNSSAVVEKIGSYNIYKTNGGWNTNIANTSINSSNYSVLYFAYKTDKPINLSNSDNKNLNEANTWYFVKLEKQEGGNWTISVKKFGEDSYVSLEADDKYFSSANATFENMFKTWMWTNDTYNHEVYATDVWGVSIVDSEIAAWEDAGAKKLGSALNSSVALDETLFGLTVYKTNGGYGQRIANTSIDASNYTELHFAFKATQQVTLSNGDHDKNVITPNTWYFVMLEKQTDGSWTISVKKVGESVYTAFVASTDFFSAEKATFETMFRTYLYAGNNTDNHEVYATDVWGVSIVDSEIRAWKSVGAEKIGSALNSSEELAEKLGGLAVYKTNGGYGQSIVNTSIDASSYTKLHFAFKATQQVTLSNGNGGVNVITPNTWYFVKLEKQVDGSWTISAKKVGDSDYTALEASDEFFGAGKATFETMFRTYLWIADAMKNNHEVYATDVWGVEVKEYLTVEGLIDSLPDTVTNADISAVLNAYDAYQALRATQQEKVDSNKVEKLNNCYNQIIGLEFSAWEAEGLTNTGFNALSNGTSAGTWGNLAINSVSNKGYDNIANTNIDSKLFAKLYFAVKADKQVCLSSGDQNAITANTWYYVKLEKQEGGNWIISVKAFGESEYTAFVASSEFFGMGNATFGTMFKTYSWDGIAYNVYATNVWGVNVVDSEIAAWEAAGAEKLGSALNSGEALAEKLGGLAVYKTNGGYGESIVNTSIDSSIYSKLYFAFKATQEVTLSNGTGGVNVITPNTWYFVQLEKQAGGNWTISVKKVGDSEYTAFTASEEFFGAGKATFETMFRTYLWTSDKYNHEVYATDVWGVSVVDSEIAAWEAAGAEKLGSALNSSEELAEKLGGLTLYKTNGGYGQSIANTSIDAADYTELYFAFKTDKDVTLSNGTTNSIKANTWYFVKLEKQEGGSWTISAKKVGDSDYTALEASDEFFSAGNATFETMFRTYLWIENAMENNHEVYATDVWGATCNHSNVVWDGNTYKCNLCQEIVGTVTENITETEEVALYTNATYAGKGASDNAFDASAQRTVTIDLSNVTNLEISGITDVALNGVSYAVSGLEANKVTVDGVVPYDVFGEYEFTAQITVNGKAFDIQKPILVITDLITTADGLLNVRKVLRGQDAEIAYNTANPVANLVIGGTGGLGTMNGRGYYKLGANIDLVNHSIANVNTNTMTSYNRVYVFGTTAVPFAGTFDGAGYVLNNFISKPNFWNYNVTTGFTYLFQDPNGVTGESHAHEIEASLFGMVDGTVKNLAITNAVFGQNGNVVNGGNGRLENVYVQINDLQADANVFVAPIAQHYGDVTLMNVVIDLTKHSSAILNGTSTAISTHYPSVIGLGAKNIENVGVYGFDTAWIDNNTSRGSVYAVSVDGSIVNTDGSAEGIYTVYANGTTNNANFWQISLDSTVWKIVDGVPMLINVSAIGTETDEDNWMGETGDGYNIAWSDEVAGSYEAVKEIRAVTNEVTGQTLGVTAEDGANIIVGTYARFATEAGVDVGELATDGRVNYGVYKNGDKIYVLADGEEGFRFAADMLLYQLYGYNELANDSFTWTESTISLENVTNETAQIAFSKRNPANGYNSGDMNFNANATYYTYSDMHNALDFLYETDGSGNVIGSEPDGTYANTNYWLSSNCDDVRDGDNINGEQLCFLAHGDKTAFNALVDQVVNRILEVAEANPTMTVINFMVEDDSEYCMCATCKPFYNPSIPQLLFLNTVAEKLETNEDLKNSCRTIDIVFFAYSSYSYAPITSTSVATSALENAKSKLGLSNTATETVEFTYAGMNKAGATYSSATDNTQRNVLKAHKNLRLQWTTDKAFHSYSLIDEANSATYLDLMAWMAAVDSSKTEVFMYQTTFNDYFLPLNTWKYQVEWYKNLNAMGINGYIFNLGDISNPTNAQTGFAAFKTYIDSRAMTDSTVTYEQLKDEFFGVNGYYGAAGSTMRDFFEELESVMNAKRQTGNYLDYGNFSHYDYNATNSPYYHYYTDGTSKQAVQTTQADRVQAWFNGAFNLPQTGILFGDIEDGALNINTNKNQWVEPEGTYTLTLPTAKTDVYVHSKYSSQLGTLKAWYQYCVTAKGMVAEDSVYAKRIQVESWFTEYALRLFHSTYTVSFELTNEQSGYTARCTGVTATLSADIGISRSATEFYNELIAGGMIRPSEQSTFDTAEKLSLGWTTFYRRNGTTAITGANCVCEISTSAFVNWGVFTAQA